MEILTKAKRTTFFLDKSNGLIRVKAYQNLLIEPTFNAVVYSGNVMW